MIYYIFETLCASGKVYNDYYHFIRSKMNDNPKKYLSPNSDWIRHQKHHYQQYFDGFNKLINGETTNLENDLMQMKKHIEIFRGICIMDLSLYEVHDTNVLMSNEM